MYLSTWVCVCTEQANALGNISYVLGKRLVQKLFTNTIVFTMSLSFQRPHASVLPFTTKASKKFLVLSTDQMFPFLLDLIVHAHSHTPE